MMHWTWVIEQVENKDEVTLVSRSSSYNYRRDEYRNAIYSFKNKLYYQYGNQNKIYALSLKDEDWKLYFEY